jgi:CxxC motif-containing protein
MISEIKNNLQDKGRDNFSVMDMQQKICNCSVPKEVIQQVFQFLMAGSDSDNLTSRLNVFLVCKKWKHWASEIDSIEFLRKQFLGEKAEAHPDLLFASGDTLLFENKWINSKIIHKNLLGGASLDNLLKSESLIINKDLVKVAKDLMKRLPFSYSSIIETKNSSEVFKDVIDTMEKIKEEINNLNKEPSGKEINKVIKLMVSFFKQYPKTIFNHTETEEMDRFLDVLTHAFFEKNISDEHYDDAIFICLLLLNKVCNEERKYFLDNVVEFIKVMVPLKNRKLALQAVIYSGQLIPHISVDLKYDTEFFLKALEYRLFIGKSSEDLYVNLILDLKKDKEFWHQAIVLDYKAMNYIDKLSDDLQFIEQAIHNNGLAFIMAPSVDLLIKAPLMKLIKENIKLHVLKELEKNGFQKEWEQMYFHPGEKKYCVQSLNFFWKIFEYVIEQTINNPKDHPFGYQKPLLKDFKINYPQFALVDSQNYFSNDKITTFEFFIQICSKLNLCFEKLKYSKFQTPILQKSSYDDEAIIDRIKDCRLKKDIEGCKLAFKKLESGKGDLLLKTISKHGAWIEYASEDFKKNKDFVINAVKCNGKALKYASNDLKNNEEVVIEAVENSSEALEFASEELKDNKKIVLISVEYDGKGLQYASEKLKDDKELVLFAVKHIINTTLSGFFKLDNPSKALSLQYASDKLRNDRDIVIAAVNNNGLALQYASDKLRNDREIVIAAVNNNGLALTFVSEALRDDKEIILISVKYDGGTILFASKDLQNDKEVVLMAVKNKCYAFEYASEELRNNEEVVIEAININGDSFEHAPDDLRDNKTVVLAAVKKKGSNLQFASLKLRDDLDVVMQAVEEGGEAVLQFASKERAKEIEEANA